MARHILKINDFKDFEVETLIASASGRDGQKRMIVKSFIGADNKIKSRIEITKNNEFYDSALTLEEAIEKYNEL